ncbi:hypothetical protein CDAR_558111 [Caerostris darwini]|uniref:Uncharacterized protein n=1 Tax=Caerostris darwini TaxID=1538125 RepID=A0AAV4R376_9ARAC|nr:hypothetical protein CDAR_558111 [Caerostris darwini]
MTHSRAVDKNRRRVAAVLGALQATMDPILFTGAVINQREYSLRSTWPCTYKLIPLPDFFFYGPVFTHGEPVVRGSQKLPFTSAPRK